MAFAGHHAESLRLLCKHTPLFKETVCVPEAVVTNIINRCSSVTTELNLWSQDGLLFYCVTFFKSLDSLTFSVFITKHLSPSKGEKMITLTSSLAHSRQTAGMLVKLSFKIQTIHTDMMDMERGDLFPRDWTPLTNSTSQSEKCTVFRLLCCLVLNFLSPKNNDPSPGHFQRINDQQDLMTPASA